MKRRYKYNKAVSVVFNNEGSWDKHNSIILDVINDLIELKNDNKILVGIKVQYLTDDVENDTITFDIHNHNHEQREAFHIEMSQSLNTFDDMWDNNYDDNGDDYDE